MRLVIVDWVDSTAGEGWKTLREMKGAENGLTCRSVGWILKESKECLVIVPHIAGESLDDPQFQVRGDMSIPKRCILKVTPKGNHF